MASKMEDGNLPMWTEPGKVVLSVSTVKPLLRSVTLYSACISLV